MCGDTIIENGPITTANTPGIRVKDNNSQLRSRLTVIFESSIRASVNMSVVHNLIPSEPHYWQLESKAYAGCKAATLNRLGLGQPHLEP